LQPNANQNSTILETGGLKTKQLLTVVEEWFKPNLNQTATVLGAVISAWNHRTTGRLQNGWNQKATTIAVAR
jgi:hypothetical protein